MLNNAYNRNGLIQFDFIMRIRIGAQLKIIYKQVNVECVGIQWHSSCLPELDVIVEQIKKETTSIESQLCVMSFDIIAQRIYIYIYTIRPVDGNLLARFLSIRCFLQRQPKRKRRKESLNHNDIRIVGYQNEFVCNWARSQV